jgi:pilus assembly protein Flp/PilA
MGNSAICRVASRRRALPGKGFTMRRLFQILRDEQAATAVEYAVMLALIIVAIIGTIGVVGAQAGGMWGGIESHLKDAGFTP